jgi:hypothetical protein
MLGDSPFSIYCDALGLAYHEARNMRHLLRRGLIEPAQPWRHLLQLPTNRYKAWSQILPLVERAKSAGTPVAAADVFVTRFGLTLEDLILHPRFPIDAPGDRHVQALRYRVEYRSVLIRRYAATSAPDPNYFGRVY